MVRGIVARQSPARIRRARRRHHLWLRGIARLRGGGKREVLRARPHVRRRHRQARLHDGAGAHVLRRHLGLRDGTAPRRAGRRGCPPAALRARGPRASPLRYDAVDRRDAARGHAVDARARRDLRRACFGAPYATASSRMAPGPRTTPRRVIFGSARGPPSTAARRPWSRRHWPSPCSEARTNSYTTA